MLQRVATGAPPRSTEDKFDQAGDTYILRHGLKLLPGGRVELEDGTTHGPDDALPGSHGSRYSVSHVPRTHYWMLHLREANEYTEALWDGDHWKIARPEAQVPGSEKPKPTAPNAQSHWKPEGLEFTEGVVRGDENGNIWIDEVYFSRDKIDYHTEHLHVTRAGDRMRYPLVINGKRRMYNPSPVNLVATGWWLEFLIEGPRPPMNAVDRLLYAVGNPVTGVTAFVGITIAILCIMFGNHSWAALFFWSVLLLIWYALAPKFPDKNPNWPFYIQE